MKIVDRKTFIDFPENTLFSKWEPCNFGPLTIKGKSWEQDFLKQQIADTVKCNDSVGFVDLCYHAARTGESISLDFDCQGRDGMFDNKQLFAVWEREDVLALIERLKLCVPNIEHEPQAVASRTPRSCSALISALRCVTDATIHNTLLSRAEIGRILREEAAIIEADLEHDKTPNAER